MKLLLHTIFSLLIFASCNHDRQSASNPPIPTPEKPKLKVSMLTSNIDPFCEMTLDNSILADTAIVGDKVIGFCHVGCKEEFLKKNK